MAKILNNTGLSRLWSRIGAKFLRLTGGTLTGMLKSTQASFMSAKVSGAAKGVLLRTDANGFYVLTTTDGASFTTERPLSVIYADKATSLGDGGLIVYSGQRTQVEGKLCVGTSYTESVNGVYCGGRMMTGVDGSSDGSIYVRNGSITDNPTSGTAKFQILSNGNATFAGSVKAANFPTTSDRRMKEDIGEIAAEKVAAARKVRLVSYRMKGDESGRVRYGAVAQELEELGLEELVYTDEETGLKAVDYTGLMVLRCAQS